MNIGELKQELIKDYNHINFRVFDIGVKHQKVDMAGNKIFILAMHKRIPSLKYVDEVNRFVSRLTDTVLVDGFKEEFRSILEDKYGMRVEVILKDYDPETEYSGTMVMLEHDVQWYLDHLEF